MKKILKHKHKQKMADQVKVPQIKNKKSPNKKSTDSSKKKDDLNQLYVSHVKNHLEPFKCSVCKYSANCQGDLSRHVKAVHNTKEPLICDICHNSFGVIGALNKHQKTVHENI